MASTKLLKNQAQAKKKKNEAKKNKENELC